MKAMILAAGLGKRMQPLTNITPKPLLKVGNRHLIEYHLEKLAQAGIREVVINTHWLAEQIPAALGSGEKWGLQLTYSHEPELLETAGGIRQALPYLVDSQEDTFLLVNGDVYFDWDLSEWLNKAKNIMQQFQACLALVPNPVHHPVGDFYLDSASHLLSLDGLDQSEKYTYSGVGLYRGSLFNDLPEGYLALGPVLKQAISKGMISGCFQNEYWLDVGTPERLEELASFVCKS